MPEHPSPKFRLHPWQQRVDEDRARHAAPTAVPDTAAYAELQVTTNFTFLTGASHPEEIVEQAAMLGHRAIAITDCNTLAGIVRAHVTAKQFDVQCIIGCRLEVDLNRLEPWRILVYPTDLAAYGRLCRLLTTGKRRAEKGQCELTLHDVIEFNEGLLAVFVPPRVLDHACLEVVEGLKAAFDDDRLSLAVSRLYREDDDVRFGQLAALSNHAGVPLVATNDVHCHVAARRPLQDVLTCIRLGCTIREAGLRLLANAERHLKSPAEMARLFADCPQAIARTVEVAERARGFTLDALRYEYPDEICPEGKPPMDHLRELTWAGARKRYPVGLPRKVRRQIEHEFGLIDELNYAPYFLTVHDLVTFARGRDILCQGRGAAANSAVCYCLGVTAVDPNRIDLLFERFISRERNEPPDIDIDFEHERREEVIQYIYQKYGRERAALTGVVVTYRARSAIREVGKALGLSLDCVDRLAKNLDWWQEQMRNFERVRELGLDPEDPTIRRLHILVQQLLGFPRHLSQHVGGFVITRRPLCELVPIENAAMEDRTIIEWDKDDIDAMNMLKVDVLGLGMLTCIRKGLELVNRKGVEGLRGSGVKGLQTGKPNEIHEKEENRNGRSENLSGSGCVAEGDGSDEDDLLHYPRHAVVGTIRVDQPDAPGSSFDCIEHRGGTRPKNTRRISPASLYCPRVAGRTEYAVRTGHGTRFAPERSGIVGHVERNKPCPAIPDHEPRRQVQHQVSGSPASPNPQPLNPLTPDPLLPVPIPFELHTIPPEDPVVYDMICRADTVGVFQIESRAQMSMLPRLRPRCFYDLVIEVAIVRPGPIQGDMVHPYLRRRRGEEPVTYPSENVRRVLSKTLGVPLFQEQAMALAMVAAGFTPDEADQLRRAMAAWKRKGNQIERFGKQLISGMLKRGYDRDFAERCFAQIKGFSEYGFPESHAASFALLVYVSCWLKCHHPAEFAAALLNSQPMGFYAPAQIVRDAQEHGVEVRPVDVNQSGWDCRLEEGTKGNTRLAPGEHTRGPSTGNPTRTPALRLGMRQIKGFSEDDADAIAGAVAQDGPFDSIETLQHRSGVRVKVLRRLARADAFNSMGLDRQQALWQVRGLRDETLPLWEGTRGDDHLPLHTPSSPSLPPVSPPQQVMHDYAALRLSLRAHPLSFLREELNRQCITPAADLRDEKRWPHGKRITVAGIVLVRQRPATASGIVFMTLEDETGIANLIVRPNIYERYRRAARHGIVICGQGRVERDGDVIHVVVATLASLDHLMAEITSQSRDFR